MYTSAPVETVSLGVVLQRLATELERMAVQSRSIEATVAGGVQGEPCAELQGLDSLTQHLDGVASVMAELASVMTTNATVDGHWLKSTLGSLALEDLADKLGGQARREAPEPGGRVELW